MRTMKSAHATEDNGVAERAQSEATPDRETYEFFRVSCPDCAQPIALLAHEEALPPHALCPTPWNPFGLTVCQGSGRPAADAPTADDAPQEGDASALLHLPEGLNWRTQPFSHITGPDGRPVRITVTQA